MDILGLSTSPSSGGAFALILNEMNGNRRLPIIIGTFEAQAIALELERIKPPRPMTHDLLRSVIQGFGSYVKFVLISELRDGTFFAHVTLDSDGNDLELDARPSDAIALAIRFDSPIYVSAAVLDDAGIVSETRVDDPVVSQSPASEPTMHLSSTAKESVEEDTRVSSLEKQLAHAIATEDYERAATLRDQINRLKA